MFSLTADTGFICNTQERTRRKKNPNSIEGRYYLYQWVMFSFSLCKKNIERSPILPWQDRSVIARQNRVKWELHPCDLALMFCDSVKGKQKYQSTSEYEIWAAVSTKPLKFLDLQRYRGYPYDAMSGCEPISSSAQSHEAVMRGRMNTTFYEKRIDPLLKGCKFIS